MFDLLIKNGIIIDGSGRKRFKSDVGIAGGYISNLGNLSQTKANKIIDAKGMFVVPGFIDILNNIDGFWTLFTMPTADSLVRQGITSVCGGNCGSSLAPLPSGQMIESIQKWVNIREVHLNWLSMKDFLKEIKKKGGLSLNFCTLVGHNTLRRGLVGHEIRDLNFEEMRIIKNMLEKALQEGAFGFSSGLSYAHSYFIKLEELVELAEIVNEKKGIYAIHLRDEGKDLVASIEEVIQLGKKTKVSIEISHLKTKGKLGWGKMKLVLQKIEEAHKQGININFDIYPYIISASSLHTYLPKWIIKGGREKMLERIRDLKLKEKIIRDMVETNVEFSKMIIAICPANKLLVGKKIIDIAQEKGWGVEEAVIEVLIASQGHVICFYPAINKEDLELELRHPLSIIASDGAAYNLKSVLSGQLVHPRCFGTFPRFLGKYVREKKLLSFEKAIQKITGMPAMKLGLNKRGFLEKGFKADIVIFDPETIIDLATFESPYQYPKGIFYVIVNGQIVIENRKHTGVLAGEVLKK